MSVTATAVTLIALAIIAVIGLDMLVRQPGTRGDRSGAREPLPEGVDPTSLRRRSPRSQRLAGAVLISAAAFIFGAIWPVM